MHIGKENNRTLIQLTYAEIVEKYTEIQKGDYVPTGNKLSTLPSRWESETSFFSVTMKQMVDTIRKGYDFPKDVMSHIPASTSRQRRRMRYTEDTEGEFDYDLYENGDTNCYLNRPSRQAMIGIKFKLHFSFSAMVRNHVIDEYGAWIGAVLDYLQSSGYDVELSVIGDARGMYPDSGVGQTRHQVILSEFGRMAMPKDWASFFSPGGYRHFMFFTYAYTGEANGWDTSMSLGTPNQKRNTWDIDWNPETRTIEVSCHGQARAFPIDEMLDKVKALNI